MECLTPKEADAWASEMTRIVGGTIPHCCSRHWHCEPGKAAKDYVPKQEEGEADVR